MILKKKSNLILADLKGKYERVYLPMIRKLLVLFIAFPWPAIAQEITFQHRKVESKSESLALLEKTIAVIDRIKSVEYISEEVASYPTTTIMQEPFICKKDVAMNKADTVHGAQFRIYSLEDTFKLQITYDQNHIVRINHETNQAFVTDISKTPFLAMSILGSFHVTVKTLLENAKSRNADIRIVEAGDSLKIELTFNNLQLECNSRHVRARDTIGFVSKYEIYVDKHTKVPIKKIRRMPYQISMETILHQDINYESVIPISAINSIPKNYSSAEAKAVKYDSITKAKFIGGTIADYRLKDVDGDSVRFPSRKGLNQLLVFTSVGWRPCTAAIPFLNELRREYHPDRLGLLVVESFIKNVEFLKDYKKDRRINYSLALASKELVSQFEIKSVPVFILINRSGVIQNIFFGYKGAITEAQVKNALTEME